MSQIPPTPAGALANIRVLDLSRVLAGPWATQLLADLGAEVIKVERPGVGDETRSWGPPFLKDAQGCDTSEAAYFLCANRNKKSITVDFTKPAGAALIREIAKTSDVVVENFKVGGLKAYGLDYDSLRALNPRLVYCSITGFGQDGPDCNRPGYDALIQAVGGLMSVTGTPPAEGNPGYVKVGVAVVDLMTGLYASNAIMAALLHRHASGAGQYIDTALLDVQVACMANQASNYLVSGRSPGRLGSAHPNIVPYQDLPTADGAVMLAVGNDGQFARLCAALGVGELAGDPRFVTNTKRVENRAALIPLLSEASRRRTSAHWEKTLEAAGVPCGPINDLATVFEVPQVKHRGLRMTMPHAAAGEVPLVASPLRLSASPVSYRSPPPLLGEHTESVLAEVLGLDEAQIVELRRDKVI